MKIAITSTGTALNSQVDPRFGRAPFFILFDTETGEFRAEDNSQNLESAQGAGIQAAQAVSRLGAEYLLTGHCGPNAFRTLTAAGIKIVVSVEGTIQEAVDRFKAGGLTPADTADVDQHWV